MLHPRYGTGTVTVPLGRKGMNYTAKTRKYVLSHGFDHLEGRVVSYQFVRHTRPVVNR